MKQTYEVKQMLEAQGTRFGVYKSGKLWEAGYITRQAAEQQAAMQNALDERIALATERNQ